jgi:hypothetical protein
VAAACWRVAISDTLLEQIEADFGVDVAKIEYQAGSE